ncbi:SdpI family protein [Tepidibacillus decaturensis]|uniref:DUF1648 domain-containing protein n=1 Tax=Tepidibacillus decaturensis TaxID=1413211 RepID=A0A135L2F1_9BACI|nr:SdpI family protein [Tepidibacillus decaturensis]KXG43120.1 hypothetical protein U473_03090 [Tepidibacillus decaturensis]
MKKSDWFLLAIILSTFAIGLILSPQLPDQIPTHWNIQGEVDSYGEKWQAILLFPGLNLFLFFLFFVTPKIDPRKESYAKFAGVYIVFRWSIHLFLALIYLLTLLYAIKGADQIPNYLRVGFIVPFLVSVLFIIIGNYSGKIKDNYFIGIRTPWTLCSKEVWYKTHRLAGKLFVITGILGIIGSLFQGMIAFILLIGSLLISVGVITLYSYLQYQKEIKGK